MDKRTRTWILFIACGVALWVACMVAMKLYDDYHGQHSSATEPRIILP